MSKANILLVDDDTSLLDSFKSILETAKFRVTAVNSAKQALQSASDEDFDLYMVDIALPDLNGDELVKELKKQKDCASVVLITGFVSFQDSIDALDLGIHDILLKPIAPEELIRVAKDAISSKPKCK